MKNYIKHHFSGWKFENDDGRYTLPENKDDWDEKSWRSLKVYLRNNFSNKKWDMIYKMMKYLRSTGDSHFKFENNNFTKHQNNIIKGG